MVGSVGVFIVSFSLLLGYIIAESGDFTSKIDLKNELFSLFKCFIVSKLHCSTKLFHIRFVLAKKTQNTFFIFHFKPKTQKHVFYFPFMFFVSVRSC